MNKNLIYGIVGTIGVIAIVATTLVFFGQPLENTKQSEQIQNMPQTMDKEQTTPKLATLNTHKIINASNPSISVNQKTSTAYAAYVKNESGLTNVYLRDQMIWEKHSLYQYK